MSKHHFVQVRQVSFWIIVWSFLSTSPHGFQDVYIPRCPHWVTCRTKKKQGIMLYHAAMPLLYYNIKSLPHHGWLSLFSTFTGGFSKDPSSGFQRPVSALGDGHTILWSCGRKDSVAAAQIGLQWSGQRALNPQVRNNEFCLEEKGWIWGSSPLGDKWPTVFCSCIEFLTLLQAKNSTTLDI